MPSPLPSHKSRLARLASATLLFAAAITIIPVPVQAQERAKEKSEVPPELNALAQELAAKLIKSDKRRIVVMDFKGPNGIWVPLSEWLADQFSAALSNSGHPFVVIDRKNVAGALGTLHFSHRDEFDHDDAEKMGKSLGADIVIQGSFGAAGNSVGISANAFPVRDSASEKFYSLAPEVFGKIAFTEEVAAKLEFSLETLRPSDGIYKSGEGGISDAVCVKCPYPIYSLEAQAKKIQGAVVLDVVINTAGRASEINIVRSAGFGLDEQAVGAVKRWKFKAAEDPDGKPVPAHTPIEVMFRLY